LIDTVEPARYKTIREARGQVLADYQKYLEKKFYADLVNKYPVKLNKEEIQKVVENK
jgi:peptidyl-prolyl cis-trans isomerase SurA